MGYKNAEVSSSLIGYKNTEVSSSLIGYKNAEVSSSLIGCSVYYVENDYCYMGHVDGLLCKEEEGDKDTSGKLLADFLT